MNEGAIQIGSRKIGAGHPAYLVAEMSGNHNGDIERAAALIHAAAEAGADAVKLQTYTPDTLTMASDGPDFVVPGDGPWAGRTLYDLYREAHTPYEWHPRLFAEARAAGVTVFSTPFDDTAVELLESLDAPAYKIASFELVDDMLLRHVASTGKPVIASTGMASLEEIAHALSVLRGAGAHDVLLLRCTSAYPAPDDEMQLASIGALAAATGCPVGLSDHSLGTTAGVVAVALGACMIEKHMTLSRADGGVDAAFSIEPDEFEHLVTEVRRVEAMVGSGGFGKGSVEEGNAVFRRSLYVVADMEEGEPFTAANLRSIRPGYGLAPQHLRFVLGRRATREIKRGTRLSWDVVGGPAV